MDKIFQGKRIAITGGTGSLGKVLVRRLLSGAEGTPAKVIVFSRDEAKQHFMRIDYQQRYQATDEIIYNNFRNILEFRIGDVRDFGSVVSLLKDADIVINAAALKQVPSCEYFPAEAVHTNILGAENIVRALREHNLPAKTVVGVSTDKACKPVNVMGMTKAIQERIFISANILVPQTRFICVRYGNVLASRGSVIPLFHQQIEIGGPLTVTTADMTRFLLPLERAVDTIIAAVRGANPGETYIPIIPSARVLDVAKAMIGKQNIEIQITGIRPGEKIHESMVSEEEGYHTHRRGEYYVIQSMLPEISTRIDDKPLGRDYSSGETVMNLEQTIALLTEQRLMPGDAIRFDGEFLR
ncbi:MAG TPA: polysaccharide biosynthesis protein [Candidatus Ozemobacteraceae bacterium]|nr:polysaccharide biosynthesis protein [Candidatus Ozemobacteraceae bacterium]